eukprot:1155849-Pelagomonas_calceolata.AAC.5
MAHSQVCLVSSQSNASTDSREEVCSKWNGREEVLTLCGNQDKSPRLAESGAARVTSPHHGSGCTMCGLPYMTSVLPIRPAGYVHACALRCLAYPSACRCRAYMHACMRPCMRAYVPAEVPCARPCLQGGGRSRTTSGAGCRPQE